MPKGADKVRVNVKERVEDESCDLSLSELTEIPVREIASFKRVTFLDLSSNRLITLGRNFTVLTRLVKLDLSKNQIRLLPDDFGQLEQLRHLDLYNNCLENLPLSFARLRRLRYLDLKGNPLTPAWDRIVGRCSTLKDCQQAAKNTVNVCANFNSEYIERERLAAQERQQSSTQMAGAGDGDASSSSNLSTRANGSEGSKLKSNKANRKTKSKKSGAVAENELTIKPVQQHSVATKSTNQKHNSKKKSTTNSACWLRVFSGVAFSSLMTFLALFIINVLIIYMIMFKNPDIADKLVEYIPHQYRDWILTKTEIFRLRVTDWISEFRTPPEEH
ncbi:leucine-rich repeat-containing protein 59 isoform X1 [Drosophila grimshawi]|uniref:Leucine-rich repeat-containing protein 59 n=1 Tax=Drosophila grimshawi TaxID=7222 RepID=B4IY79_DROGR|nr:leucine-rich repeat-containing protein 59 isoform X1 [Drosophila grimshawi]EDV96529.1 GH15147 [Drosophila grimshawi]